MHSSSKSVLNQGAIPETVRMIHILPFSNHNKKRLKKSLRDNMASLQQRVDKAVGADCVANYKLYFFDSNDRQKLQDFLRVRIAPVTLIIHGEGMPPVIGLADKSEYDLYAAPLAESLSAIINGSSVDNLTVDILSCCSSVPSNKKYMSECDSVDLNFARDLSYCLGILGMGSIKVVGYTGFVIERKRADSYSVAGSKERNADHASIENASVVFQNGVPLDSSNNPHFKQIITESHYQQELVRYYERARELLNHFKRIHAPHFRLGSLAANVEDEVQAIAESSDRQEPEVVSSEVLEASSLESTPDPDEQLNSKAIVVFKPLAEDLTSRHEMK